MIGEQNKKAPRTVLAFQSWIRTMPYFNLLC